MNEHAKKHILGSGAKKKPKAEAKPKRIGTVASLSILEQKRLDEYHNRILLNNSNASPAKR